MSVCVVSPYWGTERERIIHYLQFYVCIYLITCGFQIFSHRLNHSILDPPVAVLLHPGLLDDYSSSLFSCLSEERCWDQLVNTRAVKQCLRPPRGRRRNVFLCTQWFATYVTQTMLLLISEWGQWWLARQSTQSSSKPPVWPWLR